MFALYSTIKKEGKKITILSNDLTTSKKHLDFLTQPKNSSFVENLDGSRDFLLIFNTEHNKIIAIETEKKKKETKGK